jgi:hypothetical protein
LSSLSDNVFNHVFASENAKELWKTINENHESTKDVANERYHVLIDNVTPLVLILCLSDQSSLKHGH